MLEDDNLRYTVNKDIPQVVASVMSVTCAVCITKHCCLPVIPCEYQLPCYKPIRCGLIMGEWWARMTRHKSGSHMEGSSTHWGRVTHICVGKLSIISSDNGLSPGWRQAIIWTKAGILWIGLLGTNISEILIGIQTFSLHKIRLKMSSAKCCPFRLCLNVINKAARDTSMV